MPCVLVGSFLECLQQPSLLEGPQGYLPFRMSMGLIALASAAQRGRNDGLRRLLVSVS